MPIRLKNLVRCALPLALVLVALGACRRKEVQVYTAPKDRPFNPAPAAPATQTPAPTAAERELWRPALTYTVPAGWQELGPDAANIARFSGGGTLVAVTPLMSMQGNEVGLVNMWRQVRGQSPLGEEEANKTLLDVPIAGDTGKMFEVMDAEGGEKRRFIVAFVHRPEGSLFFKIQGDDAGVLAQKPAFLEFLKSVNFAAGSTPKPSAAPEAPSAATSEPPATPPAPPNLPEGWTPVAPGPMQVAKFTVPEKDGGKAEVAISIFPSDTGGVASNVKRWRGQIGLPEGDDDTALGSTKPLEGAPEGSVLVDLQNGGRGLLGAIVPRDGKWWFYKMMGDTPAVTAARESFIGFAKAQP